jgi:hypothetical protein
MKNNIVSTTQVVKKKVECVDFILPHGDGVYKLFVDPETLAFVAIQYWTDNGREEEELISSQHKALQTFCEDIDIHIERCMNIPQRVWDVIKANPIRSLWFVDGLNINLGGK